MQLADAQKVRRARGEKVLDAEIEALLDQVGLTESAIELAVADVSPDDRQKLKGIIKRLRGKTHPFTTCMNDLRTAHPEWSDERRKKTCGTLKALTGRKEGSDKMGVGSEGACVLIDDRLATLLGMVNLEALTPRAEEATQ